MVSTRLCIIAIVSVLLAPATLAQPSALSPAPKAFDLHLTGSPNADLVQAIAEVGEPRRVAIEPGHTPRSIIESRCGIVHPAYVSALLELDQDNGRVLSLDDLDLASRGENLRFPACLRIETTSYMISAAQTISDVYAAHELPFDAKAVQDALSRKEEFHPRAISSLHRLKDAGSTGTFTANRGFMATEYARQFVLENSHVVPTKMKPGDMVWIAPRTLTATIPVRSDMTIEEALGVLQRSAGPHVLVDSQASVAELVEDVPTPEACIGDLDIETWPLPIQELREALDENAKLRPAPDRYRPTTVLVIDAGYDPETHKHAVPATWLGAMTSWNGKSLPRYPGVNTATGENDPTPPPGLKARDHGIEVAATLLGRRFLEGRISSQSLPRVVFASIAQEAGDAAFLNIHAINTAYRRAIDSSIPVVNASISAHDYREAFITELAQGRDSTLVVAAAGNTQPPFQRFEGVDQPWPGSMGGDPGNVWPGLVLSVGAHGPDGSLLSFSRVGEDQVDLLAPGCRIPTFGRVSETNIGEKELNGTSFAAPIVAYVAALLASESLRPKAIKNRLIVSADMDEKLVSHVYSAGRLDVRKTLSVYLDLVDYVARDDDTGEPLLGPRGQPVVRRVSGILKTASQLVEVCGKSVRQGDLRRLAVTATTDGPFIRGWRTSTTKAGIARVGTCPTPAGVSGEMTFKVGDGTEVSIPLANIVDFVAKEP